MPGWCLVLKPGGDLGNTHIYVSFSITQRGHGGHPRGGEGG